MKRKFEYLIVALMFLPFVLFAQDAGDIKLPDGLGMSNQLEYSYDVDAENEIMENWFNLDYTYGIFSTGLRFDIFQPNDPNAAVSRGKDRFAEINYKYLKATIGNKKRGMDITIGNFYELFGRGMILKSYEDRSIRIDNNLLGVNVSGQFDGLKLTGLTGMAENFAAERKDILHAFDMEYKFSKNLKTGGTFAVNRPDNNTISPTRMAGLRVQPSFWNFDFYGEYGMKFNDDISNNFFAGEEKHVGEGIYANMNFYLGGFGLTTEYKKYDNFAFTSNDQTISYNTPPAVKRDQQYLLLNRHITELNVNNEEGFQVEASYNLSDYTSVLANYSYTYTLGESSFYQRQRNLKKASDKYYEDLYLNIQHTWSDKFTTIFAFGYGEEYYTLTKSITPIAELRYYLDDINSFKMIVEHQQTTQLQTGEKYFDDVLLIEYLRSPNLSVSLVSEMLTKEPTAGNKIRTLWNFIQVGYKLWEHTDVSVAVGSRQAGTICIGGVCRYEPEFRGVELKMKTILY